MTVGVTQARRIGALAVACASTGNTVRVARRVRGAGRDPRARLRPRGSRVAGQAGADARVRRAHDCRLRGDFDDCLALAREACDRLGIYLVNSINPFRVEGQKTIVFELLQQLGWEAPDWIALPAGNLGNTAAFGKALREAHALGLIDRVPRTAGRPGGGRGPLRRRLLRRLRDAPSRARRDGGDRDPDRRPRLVGSRRRCHPFLERPRRRRDRCGDLRREAGDRRCGVGCEPASAASVAGVRVLAERGIIGRRRSRRRGAHGSSAEGSRRRPRGPRRRRPRLRRLAHARRGAWPPRTRACGLLRRRATRIGANFRRCRSEAVTILHCASRRATHRG